MAQLMSLRISLRIHQQGCRLYVRDQSACVLVLAFNDARLDCKVALNQRLPSYNHHTLTYIYRCLTDYWQATHSSFAAPTPPDEYT